MYWVDHGNRVAELNDGKYRNMRLKSMEENESAWFWRWVLLNLCKPRHSAWKREKNNKINIPVENMAEVWACWNNKKQSLVNLRINVRYTIQSQRKEIDITEIIYKYMFCPDIFRIKIVRFLSAVWQMRFHSFIHFFYSLC